MALFGKLLVVRYSQGDDIIVLTPGGTSLDIVASQTGNTGFTGFSNPLDLTENLSNGNLYVSEYGASKITLLRPLDAPDCPADLDCSGSVGVDDMLALFADWSKTIVRADFTGPAGVPDGYVGVDDFLGLFSAWGLCP